MSENYIRSEIEDMKEFMEQIWNDIPIILSSSAQEFFTYDERVEIGENHDVNLRAIISFYHPEKPWKYLLANKIKELVSSYLLNEMDPNELNGIVERYSDVLNELYERATDDATKVKIDLYLLKDLIDGCIADASNLDQDPSIDIPTSFLIDLL